MTRPSATASAGRLLDDLPPGQLIVSIYGLYGRANHNSIAISSLVRMMAELGVDEPAVRASVSRLKRRGILSSVRTQHVVGYTLSRSVLDTFQEGDVRIFGRKRATLDDGWLLVIFSVPETRRHKRHELRTRLTRLGFGIAAAGVWIAPATITAETEQVLARTGLDAYVDIFRGERVAYGDPAEKVSQWWDLDELSNQYGRFIQWYSASAAQYRHRSVTAALAFAEYVPLVTRWRRLPYVDPGLPLAVLPRPWNGVTAAGLFSDLNERLANPAARYAHELMTTRSRPARTEAPHFATRDSNSEQAT